MTTPEQSAKLSFREKVAALLEKSAGLIEDEANKVFAGKQAQAQKIDLSKLRRAANL